MSTRVFLLRGPVEPLGTGFRICKPALVLTAAHVIEGLSPAEVGVVVLNSSRAPMVPTRIAKHPEADVAALFLNEAETAALECFNLGMPPSHQHGYYLMGEEIVSYGFALIKDQPFRGRLMKGHIQSHFWAESKEYGGYKHDAYELSFPSFGGMSGSPVMRHQERRSVIAIVTANLPYQDVRRETRADWAISVALPPLAAWLDSLARQSDAP